MIEAAPRLRATVILAGSCPQRLLSPVCAQQGEADGNDVDRPYPASNVHDVHVEPPLPLLECRVRGSAEAATPSFLLGERSKLRLRLTNRGALPIADVDVRIQPMFVQNSEQKQIAYYSEEELQAEQELSGAKPQLIPSSASFSSAASTPSTQLPASLSFTSSPANRRVFDFARSVSQSRQQSVSDSASTSPAAAPTALRSAAAVSHSLLPPLTWSTSALVAALPLLPGQHVDIAVQVNAISEWSVVAAADAIQALSFGEDG